MKNRTIKTIKLIVVLVLVASLASFVGNSDWKAIETYLLKVGWKFSIIILLTFFAMMFGTISWRYTLPKDLNISLFRLFTIRLVGENIGLINPSNFIGGDAFKAHSLKKEGVNLETGVSSLLVSRIIMIFTQIVIFVIVAFFFLFKGKSTFLLGSLIGISIVLATLVFGVLLILTRLDRISLLSKITWIDTVKWTKRITQIFNEVNLFYRQKRKRFVAAVFFTSANWILGAFEIWLIFRYLDVGISSLDSILVDQGVLMLKSFGAMIPGQIGVEEYSNKVMLSIIGISSAGIWLAVSILRRSRQIFWILFGTLIYLIYYQHVKVENLHKKVQSENN